MLTSPPARGIGVLRARLVLTGVLLVLALVGLRLAWLTGQSLWYDEGFSLALTNGPTLQEVMAQLSVAPGSERYQPLYFLVLFSWRSAIGDSEIALRLLSVLLGAAAVVILVSAAWRAYGRHHALWTALIGTTSALAVSYSQEVRPYSLLLLVAAAQLWSFLELVCEEHGRRSWVARGAFWVSCGIGFASGILLAPFTAALFLTDLLVRRNPRAAVGLWWPVAVLALPAIVFYGSGLLAQESGAISSATGSLLQNGLFVIYGLLVGTTYGPPLEELHGQNQVRVLLDYWPSLMLLAVVAGTLVVLVLRGFKIGPETTGARRADRIVGLLLVFGFALGVAFAAASGLNWLPRHSIYLLAPLVLLLPATLRYGREPGRGDRIAVGAARLSLLALVALNLYSLGHYFLEPRYARDDYRGAAAFISRQADPSTSSVLLWGQPELLAYYGARATIDGRELDQSRIDDEIWRVTAGSPRVVVAVNRDFYWDPEGIEALDRVMARRYRLVDMESYPYFAIHTFEARPSPTP